jgi:hypothetical protein
MNIYTRIAQAVSATPDTDAATIAAVVSGSVTKSAMVPLIVAEVKHEQRRRSRLEEHRFGSLMVAHFRNAPVTVASSSDVSRLRRLLDAPIPLFDGESVTWGRATLDQLRQRRAELVRQRAGLDQSIALLDEVIGVLETSGADCLDNALVD